MTNTEAFYRLHRFNESFDRNLKVTFGALEGLRTGTFPVTNGRTDLPIGQEPWRKATSLTDPQSEGKNAIRLTATMGIVRVTAALEDFLETLEADYNRTAFTREKGNSTNIPIEAEHQLLKIPSLAARIGIDPAPLAYLMPFHRYFTLARNCIVHRSGRATGEFEEFASSGELRDCHSNWITKRGSPMPVLPNIVAGGEIDWLPRHTILCLAVYYSAAKYLNDQMVILMGPKGLAYMAAHYVLFDADTVASRSHRRVEVAIRTVLHNRYRYRGLDNNQLISALRAMGKWQSCSAAFAARLRDDVRSKPQKSSAPTQS